jgi:hypothetical protein
MKKVLLILALASVQTGCMSLGSQAQKKEVETKSSPKLKDEARIAEKLPIVTRDQVNSSNFADMERALSAEMDRDSGKSSVASTRKP